MVLVWCKVSIFSFHFSKLLHENYSNETKSKSKGTGLMSCLTGNRKWKTGHWAVADRNMKQQEKIGAEKEGKKKKVVTSPQKRENDIL